MDSTHVRILAGLPPFLGRKLLPSEAPRDMPAPEGEVNLIYGRIRQGKSTHTVYRIMQCLRDGVPVYSNIALDLSSTVFDDRLSAQYAFSSLFKTPRHFYFFDRSNFHWFNPATGQCDGVQVFNPKVKGAEIEWLNTLTDCYIFYDEGQWLLDSYEGTYASVAKRKFITETGHMNRTIFIIAQRTQSVHVNARGNVNRFYRCSKVVRWFFFKQFMVEEFQDMRGTDVDESIEPVSVQFFSPASLKPYWGLFNTHYLRDGKPRSQDVHYGVYELSTSEVFDVLAWHMVEFVKALGQFFRLQPEKLPGVQSLGVNEESATIKNGERLNTVPVGGFVPAKKKKVDFSKLRQERLAQKEIENATDQGTLPF